MGCVVEVTVTEDELVGQMNHMRAWLDHRRFEPSSFTLSEAHGGRVVRVLFKNAARRRRSRRSSGAGRSPRQTPGTWPPERRRVAPLDRLSNTIRFLRLAASELRRLAERIPEIADELQSMAGQLEAEADDLTSDPEPPPTA